MKFSMDPDKVSRISASGYNVPNPKVPTMKPSAEEIAGLTGLLTRIEKTLGREITKWVETAELHFRQSEEQIEWMAFLQMVFREPGSGTEIVSQGNILREWLSNDQTLLMATTVVANRIKGDIKLRRDELFKTVGHFDAALALMVVPKRI